VKILVADDDPQFLRALRITLRARGYQVLTATDGADAIDQAARHRPDLYLVDLGMPHLDGLGLIHSLRGWTAAPILVVSGRTGSDDKVDALDAGADDYVTKPFELPELAARVRAFGRRRAGQAQPLIEVGPLVFDTVGREVRANGQRLSLSVRELSVLEMLMARVGRVVTKRQIVNSLSAWDADFSENAVEVYVYRLRKRLEGTGASIQTVRGFGYMLDVETA
jgi:DNA-binding response OmpR family regulator